MIDIFSPPPIRLRFRWIFIPTLKVANLASFPARASSIGHPGPGRVPTLIGIYDCDQRLGFSVLQFRLRLAELGSSQSRCPALHQ